MLIAYFIEMGYTLQQRAQLLLWFAEAQEDDEKFARMIRFELGDEASIPAKKTVRAWEANFLKTGSVADAARIRPV